MNILLWREIIAPYQLCVDELVVKFEHLMTECKISGTYCPIESVSGRVKSVSSILEKMRRKEIPIDKLEEQVEDIAGIRLITQFAEDIDLVVDLIDRRTDMKIKAKKDYISNKKESGYRSFHLIISYTVQTMNGPKELSAEIQIRTMAMDFWATIEHSLQYKYKEEIPARIREKLSNAAEAIDVIDHEMSAAREEIVFAQNSSRLKVNLISTILTDIESLYRITSNREVEKIQAEFFRIYMQNDMEALQRFHRELDLIAEGYKVQAVKKDI